MHMAGGYSAAGPPSAEARHVALSLRTAAESALRVSGAAFAEFEPVAASQQVVAGMNYAIKARRRRADERAS